MPWDVKRNVALIQKELGWKGDQVEGMPWSEYPYEKIECHMQGVRDYVKYLKRGYGRVTQMTALDLRNGRITMEKARALIDEYEGKKPPSLELFLDYVGLTEEEFNAIVAKTVVPPYKPDFNAPYAPKTWDFDNWYRETEGNGGIRRKPSSTDADKADRRSMIGIFNIGLGNLRSVENAVYQNGFDP